VEFEPAAPEGLAGTNVGRRTGRCRDSRSSGLPD
jgi:hypothetical protein